MDVFCIVSHKVCLKIFSYLFQKNYFVNIYQIFFFVVKIDIIFMFYHFIGFFTNSKKIGNVKKTLLIFFGVKNFVKFFFIYKVFNG